VKLIYSIGNQSAFDFTLNGSNGIVKVETLSIIFHLKKFSKLEHRRNLAKMLNDSKNRICGKDAR
jgi:hypothetical protein